MRQLQAVALFSTAVASTLVVTCNQLFGPKQQCETEGQGKKGPTVNQSQAARSEESKMAASGSSANDDEFTKPIFKNGRYENPWENWRKPGLSGVLKMVLTTKNTSNIPSQEELDHTLPIMKPNIAEFDKPLKSGVRMMWIGHATVVAQLDGFTVITDPVFSSRSAPVQWLGPKRYRDPPCSIEELPRLDAVVISHNHYDHLDHGSVVALNRRFGRDLKWFVPMGLKSWMQGVGCENVEEMMWWQEHEVEGTGGLRIACTPCQHWCKRGAWDDNKVLWSSWCVLGPKHSFHFAGDTGLCQGFQQIGRKYGPFTAAAIPIGAYHPRWFMSPQHVDPGQAVQIHQDIQCKNSLGIHWGTFVLTWEHYLEPRNLLKEEVEKAKLDPDAFITINHGAIATFGANN